MTVPSNNFSYEVIILGAFDAEPVEFRVKTADALEDADVARLAERFANQFRLHSYKLPHYPAKIKPNFAPLVCLAVTLLLLKNGRYCCFRW